MHAGESKGGVEFRHDSGKFDDVLDARLAGLFDEVRLHLEHRWIRGRDEHSALYSSQRPGERLRARHVALYDLNHWEVGNPPGSGSTAHQSAYMYPPCREAMY